MKKYVPTDTMPKHYNLLDMIKAGLDPALAVDMLTFDKSLPTRERVNKYDCDNPVTSALLGLGWIKEGCEKTYRIGQKFHGEGCDYLLAQVSANHVALICLKGGNRWHDPQKVENISAITVGEMLNITLGEHFMLIEE